jgi:hypothetical protein
MKRGFGFFLGCEEGKTSREGTLEQNNDRRKGRKMMNRKFYRGLRSG